MKLHLKPLSDQVMVITGASSGIGLTTAEMAAARHLRSGGGAIINVGAVACDRATPLMGIYSAAKHAVKGYTDALRMELEHDGIPISVSLVKPGSINTPFIEHARSHMDAEPELMPPVYPPEEVARAILKCAEHPMREVLVGGAARLLSGMGTVAPWAIKTYLEATAFTQQKRAEPNDEIDSLYTAQSDGHRRGPTSRYTMSSSAYTRASTSAVGRALPLLAAGAVAAGVAFRWSKSNGRA